MYSMEVELLCIQFFVCFSKSHPELTLDDAYAIQTITANSRLKAGKKLVGYKIGLTSKEAQKQFQLFHPDFGHLFEHMRIPNGGELRRSDLIQPRIEVEIAFAVSKDIKGPGMTPEDVARAIEYAVAAFEIVDSRIKDWKITAIDTVSDNGSSARFVLGEKKVKLDELDLSTLGAALLEDGEIVSTGVGGAVMNHPVNAATFLINELGKYGKGLAAGDIILSGAMGPMVRMDANKTYTAEFLSMGQLSLRVTP